MWRIGPRCVQRYFQSGRNRERGAERGAGHLTTQKGRISDFILKLGKLRFKILKYFSQGSKGQNQTLYCSKPSSISQKCWTHLLISRHNEENVWGTSRSQGYMTEY